MYLILHIKANVKNSNMKWRKLPRAVDFFIATRWRKYATRWSVFATRWRKYATRWRKYATRWRKSDFL